MILRLSSATGSNIFTLQGQTDKLRIDGKGIVEVPVVVRMAAFHQGIGKVRMFECVERIYWKCVCFTERERQFVCIKGIVQ